MKFLNNLFRHAGIALVLIFSVALLALFVKGDKGTPTAYQTIEKNETHVSSPYESSNSRSRYVLTQALVEDKKATLTKEQAKFASPDVSRYNDKFFSIFMPGISFIAVPFYMLGQLYGIPQLTSYLSVTLFGFINMLLIARVAYKLGANKYASMLGGFLFLFATNALPYSLFLTQHITSVTALLVGLLAAMGKPNIKNALIFGASAGISLLLDVPNVLLMLPIGLYFLSRYFSVEKQLNNLKLHFNPRLLMILFGVLPFIAVLGWYNLQTTGTYTKIGQTVGQSSYFMTNLTKDAKVAAEAPASSLPFTPRAQIEGFYTLLISDERSWLFYSPVVLLGLFGLIRLYRQERYRAVANAISGTILINIVLYGMFHDPWGGWAFGPRYLIPAAAMMCIGLALAIKAYVKKLWFIVAFGLISIVSITISVLGALTTSLIPPKSAAEHMANPIPYTFGYNIQLAQHNTISSLAYHEFFANIPGIFYIGALSGVLVIMTIYLYIMALNTGERRVRHDA